MACTETKGTITPGRGQEDPNSGKFGSFFKAGGENGTTQADMVRGLVCGSSLQKRQPHTALALPRLCRSTSDSALHTEAVALCV